MKKQILTGKIILNKYLVGSCIGFGSFGQVYLVYDTISQQILAMKAQQDKTKNPQLTNQAKIMKLMSTDKGFVPFKQYGYQAKHNMVVMGLLGPSLEDLFNICNRSFSLKTILMLAEQIINRLEIFHSKNYVYRDIKPQNFLMGLHEHSHIVHMIDFGLSKKYRDAKNHQHISYREGRPFVGTVRYCSINCHMGIQYSRRDDLESIGYMFQYFFKGSLPWQGIVANTNTQKYAKILHEKQNIAVQLQFMDMPVQFSTFMHYCRSLKFTDRPDYTFLRKLFTDLMDKLGYQRDYNYDWCKLKHTIKLQNGTMSLSVQNKFTDLESPYVTFVSNQIIQQTDIKLDISNQGSNLYMNKSKVKGFTNGTDAVNQQIITQTQNIEKSQNSNEGNIQSEMLEDSDLKLISHRSKWYDSYI